MLIIMLWKEKKMDLLKTTKRQSQAYFLLDMYSVLSAGNNQEIECSFRTQSFTSQAQQIQYRQKQENYDFHRMQC